jgi:hypothetical protein
MSSGDDGVRFRAVARAVPAERREDVEAGAGLDEDVGVGV